MNPEATAEGRRARRYRDLVVWQNAMRLALRVYKVSSAWPADERFGLTSQVRRAAVSIPANSAEGQGRLGQREFTRFVAIAHGSLCELETELSLAQDLDFSTAKEIAECLTLADEVGRMCRALLAKGDSRFKSDAVK